VANGDYVLKGIGTGREPIPQFWVPSRIGASNWLGFSGHRGKPNLGEGTHVLLYAPGWMRTPAAGMITSDPEYAPDPGQWIEDHSVDWKVQYDRWPWTVSWEPRLIVPDVQLAPHIDDLGINRLSVRSQSYVNIAADVFDLACELMAKKAHA
jgi:hypothetical protein